MKRITQPRNNVPMARPLMVVLATLASAVLAACAQGGAQGGMDHGAMGSGTTSGGGMGMGMGMDMMKAGADCPMSAEQRKTMCEGKSDDDCKRILDEHRQAMDKRMKEHMKDGMKADGTQPSSGTPDGMCDMGKKATP